MLHGLSRPNARLTTRSVIQPTDTTSYCSVIAVSLYDKPHFKGLIGIVDFFLVVTDRHCGFDLEMNNEIQKTEIAKESN